jgi:hypothetical protein
MTGELSMTTMPLVAMGNNIAASLVENRKLVAKAERIGFIEQCTGAHSAELMNVGEERRNELQQFASLAEEVGRLALERKTATLQCRILLQQQFYKVLHDNAGDLTKRILERKGHFPKTEWRDAELEQQGAYRPCDGAAYQQLTAAARFFSENHRRLSISCRLHHAICELDRIPLFDMVLHRASEIMTNMLKCDRFTYWLSPRDDDRNLWSKTPRMDGYFGFLPLSIPKSAGLVGACYASMSPMLIGDAYADPRFDRSFDSKHGYRTNAVMVVPVLEWDEKLKRNRCVALVRFSRMDYLEVL